MSLTEARLTALGIVLPPPPAPAANYLSSKAHGGLLYASGRRPRSAEGKPIAGRVGLNLTTAEAYAAAGSLDHISVISLFGTVNATPDFAEHSKVIDGCSDLFVEVLGERGRHARSAIGVASLPNGMSVEIETTFSLLQD